MEAEKIFPPGIFCVFHLETDGYTYSADMLVGLYQTQADAETAILLHTEEMAVVETRLREIDQLFYAVCKEGGLGCAQAVALSEERVALQKLVENKPLDSRVDHYSIRQVATGEPIQDC